MTAPIPELRDMQALADLAERMRDELRTLERMLPSARRKSMSVRRVETLKRAHAARRRYTDEQREAWPKLALLPEIASLSGRGKARYIAKLQGLPAKAAGTIRRAL